MSRKCKKTLSGEHWQPNGLGQCGACGEPLNLDDHRTGCGCPAHGPPRADPMTFEDQETHQLRNDLRDARELIGELLDHQADLAKFHEVKKKARAFLDRG